MKIINVERNNADIRVDKFLAQEFFSLSRGEIIRNIKAGKILVNDKAVKPSYNLRENDVIKSQINFSREGIVPNEKIKLHKIYEDDNVLVIDKPAGLQVHPDANEKGNTIVNFLIARYPEIKDVHDESLGAHLRPGIVHRLDKNTSGVLIIAKNINTLEELKKLFQERKIRKKYLAIVIGNPKDRKGMITKAIARAGNYRKQVVAGAKTKTKVRGAVTLYKILQNFKGYSLLSVEPKTGRMHQIRVHLASIGHPVVGDKKYTPKNIKQPEIKRHLLHAENLELNLFGEKYKFKAGMPEDFHKFLNAIFTEK